MLAIKSEPIEISSDSDSDPIDVGALRAESASIEGRAAIAADLEQHEGSWKKWRKPLQRALPT